jgi:hypothetical protein
MSLGYSTKRKQTAAKINSKGQQALAPIGIDVLSENKLGIERPVTQHFAG